MAKEAVVKKKRTNGRHTDLFLTGAVLFLLVFSMLMISSASISSSDTVVKNVISSLAKQAVFAVAGLIAYVYMIYHFDLSWFAKNIFTLLGIEFALLVSCRLFNSVGGAYAWIRIPGVDITVQPSEFAKSLIIITVALFMGDIKTGKKDKGWDVIKVPVVVSVIYVFVIVIVQHDFGSGFAFLSIASIIFLMPSNKLFKKYQVTVIVLMLVVVVATIGLMSPGFKNFLTSDSLQQFVSENKFFGKIFGAVGYQFYRFISAGDPLWDRFGYSQELLNSLLGIARGNLFGVGLGNSIQKFGYLASADADYIFPVIVEELGIIGIACVFIPYIIIITVLIRYAMKVETEREKIILIGTASYIFVHLFLNIGGVTALIPLTGVPLILISRGGASLVAIMFTLGCCQNIISRYKGIKNEDNSR